MTGPLPIGSVKTFLLILCIGGLLSVSEISAASPKDQYNKADACYQKLLRSPKKQKYRDNWLRCIEMSQKVYRQSPSGSWAAAGLYMSGRLYRELYQRSFRASDRRKAIDAFNRITERHPKSRYRPKAEAAIAAMAEKGQKNRRHAPPPSAKKAKEKYHQADACYRQLLKSEKRQRYRDNWLQCIDGFKAVYRHDPSGSWAAAGLYMSGRLYHGLFRYSGNTKDRKEAIAYLQQVIGGYPKSRYHEKARVAIAEITGAAGKTGVAKKSAEPPRRTDIPGVRKTKIAKKKVEPIHRRDDYGDGTQTGTITVTGLRHWSNPNYTRIVVDADGNASYTHRLLKKDTAINKPPRLYVDIKNGRLGNDIETIIPINDNLLADVRAGQYTPDTVRVVVDIKSFKTYKIFSLRNPFRIVIDVWGKAPQETQQASAKRRVKKPGKQATAAKRKERIAPSALAKQLSLGVKRIVIDPGHGGRDRGASGYIKGVYEKDVVLRIAKRLATKIRQQLGCEVILTRTRDKYLTLEERTAIANTQNADLFISIHTNAANDRRAHGIMTFFLNLATDNDAILVAARENATSTKNISDLQTILSDLMQNAKINESSRLAGHVQTSLYQHMKTQYSRIKSKGVKQAPFYVLLGAQMPAILVETSFISNARECKRLTNTHYQDHMSQGIIKGIRAYIRETKPTVLLETEPKADTEG